MSISSSAHKPKRLATTASEESAVAPPITLSERSSTGLALLCILVGYLWFQQLFWKLPPTFAGLYEYVVRESQHAILPGYSALLQHTFPASCPSLSSPVGCTSFVPLAACIWTAELLVSISLLFGLFTRFGAILATVLALQLYVIVLGGVFGLIFGALQRGKLISTARALLTGMALGVLWWLLFEVVLANITNHASAPFSLNFANFLASFPLDVLFGVLLGAISIQWQGHHGSRQPS